MSGLPSTHLVADLSSTLMRWVTLGGLKMPNEKEGCGAERGPLGLVQLTPGPESAVRFYGSVTS